MALSGADVGHLAVAAGLTAFVLEIRHIRWLDMLDGRRLAGRFGDDDEAPPGRRRASPGDQERSE
jgi:hypothetical protein